VGQHGIQLNSLKTRASRARWAGPGVLRRASRLLAVAAQAATTSHTRVVLDDVVGLEALITGKLPSTKLLFFLKVVCIVLATACIFLVLHYIRCLTAFNLENVL